MATTTTKKRAAGRKAASNGRATSKRKPARGKSRAATRSAGAAAQIQFWPTDPLGALQVLRGPVPDLPGEVLPTQIVEPAPAPTPEVHAPGTPGFRYWTAAEALRRAAAFWTQAGVAGWNSEIGDRLPVRLDEGVDLNAFYARNDFPPQGIVQGLSFFHDTVREVATGRFVTVFSGESPDIIAHELGHAVLDSIKPNLFDVSTTEAAALHESFGDISAVLTALQLPEVRKSALQETDGRLRRNSSVSRVAEQLGFAIRQRSATAVDVDALRNASNAFVYVDPTTLPASGPASSLSRAPHNFSRVFTGAFLEALSGMVLTLADPPTEADVLEASSDMGRLLVRAIGHAPLRTRLFQAVAEQMILADSNLFTGKYAQALTSALVGRGLLPVRSLAAAPAPAGTGVAEAAASAVRSMAEGTGGVDNQGDALEMATRPRDIMLDGASLGLVGMAVRVWAPAIDDAQQANLAMGIVAEALPRRDAVQAFVEELVLRGRVAIESRLAGIAPLLNAMRRRTVTHVLVRENQQARLRRVTFDCGC